jgi:hypothetical protein
MQTFKQILYVLREGFILLSLIAVTLIIVLGLDLVVN